ncbi:MAG: radical SAM protein [Candidatus Omnitrophota bacterium]
MAIKKQGYAVFSNRIHRLANEERFPLRAMFELTYRCNFKCIHCYNTETQKKTKPQNELTTRQVFDILTQLKRIGCLYLGFTGGEIFLRHDILDIIIYARKLGFELILLTNGSLINRKVADRLSKLRLNKIDITVHAMNDGIFDKITQIPGSAKKVFRAIKLLYKRNIPLGLKSCGMRENKDEVVKIQKFASGIKAIYRLNTELLACNDRGKTPFEHRLSAVELYSLYKDYYPEGFAFRAVKKEKSGHIFPCGVGKTDLTINPFGGLQLCLAIDYPKYDILKGGLALGWQKIKEFVDELKAPAGWVCAKCDLVPFCRRCPAKGYLEDGNFFSCNHYSRQQAEFIKEMQA